MRRPLVSTSPDRRRARPCGRPRPESATTRHERADVGAGVCSATWREFVQVERVAHDAVEPAGVAATGSPCPSCPRATARGPRARAWSRGRDRRSRPQVVRDRLEERLSSSLTPRAPSARARSSVGLRGSEGCGPGTASQMLVAIRHLTARDRSRRRTSRRARPAEVGVSDLLDRPERVHGSPPPGAPPTPVTAAGSATTNGAGPTGSIPPISHRASATVAAADRPRSKDRTRDIALICGCAEPPMVPETAARRPRRCAITGIRVCAGSLPGASSLGCPRSSVDPLPRPCPMMPSRAPDPSEAGAEALDQAHGPPAHPP
jgi:hypothetical protein